MALTKEDLQALSQLMDVKLDPIKADVSGLKKDMVEVKSDVSGLKKDMVEVKSDVSGLKKDALPRRICIETDNDIRCSLDLSATGNLCLPEYHSWQEMDENSMGNIMQESLAKIFERNQWKELCCNEIARLGRCINTFYGSKEADEKREFFVECFKRMKNYRYRAHLLFPYLDYYECTMLSMYMVEQDTKGHWLKFTLKGYDKDIFTPEFLRQAIDDLVTANDIRKREGKPKVQLVPYNPEINHIDGCTDLDEQS